MNEVNKNIKSLYKTAGILGILMLILIPIQIAIFSIYKIPTSIDQWFELFKNNWILGLIQSDFLYIINNIIIAIIYLALYLSLKEKNKGLMIIAITLGLLGVSAYLSSNKSFEIMSLSNNYFNSFNQIDKTIYLSAGQTMISSWQGTAFDIYYVLSAICLLIISFVMLKDEKYGKKIATLGIISGIFMIIPSTAGTIGLIFSILSLIPWMFFLLLISKKFIQFSK